ncbi:MAG: hypothetical protein Q8881_02070 [Sweet potato little leaf phytoplasma]|nr:hypothetical protein [Sweet potato little leaf phytoplasma]
MSVPAASFVWKKITLGEGDHLELDSRMKTKVTVIEFLVHSCTEKGITIIMPLMILSE